MLFYKIKKSIWWKFTFFPLLFLYDIYTHSKKNVDHTHVTQFLGKQNSEIIWNWVKKKTLQSTIYSSPTLKQKRKKLIYRWDIYLSLVVVSLTHFTGLKFVDFPLRFGGFFSAEIFVFQYIFYMGCFYGLHIIGAALTVWYYWNSLWEYVVRKIFNKSLRDEDNIVHQIY